MNLRDKVKDIADTNTKLFFEAKYPEVHEWFHSSEFVNQMANKGELTFRIYTIKQGIKEDATGLPIEDSDGLVDMDEVVSYLKAEGFVAYTRGAFVDTLDLYIRLS